MGNRFSDIKRGAQLKTGLDNYVNYLSTLGTRPSRIGQQGPRDLSKTLFVQPFTAHVAATEFLQVKNSDNGFTQLGTYINGSTLAATTDNIGGGDLVTLPKFRASRVVLQLNQGRQVRVERSEFTNLEYLHYEHTRYSCAFGATADTDDEMEAFLDIKAAILTALSGANEVCRVSLSREYVGVG